MICPTHFHETLLKVGVFYCCRVMESGGGSQLDFFNSIYLYECEEEKSLEGPLLFCKNQYYSLKLPI